MVKTVTLTADTTQKVTFEGAYPYYWIDNKTASDVYASVGVPEADADGTYTVAAGSQMRISGGVGNNGITLLGEGKVQIIASTIAACPFKVAPAVGGGGESDSVDEFLNISSTNPVQNKAIKAELDKKANSKHSHNVADISDFPDIPDKNTVIDWGFYVKATSGIPKSDLAADVQASLNKADTALQQHQSLAEYVKNDDARLTDARPANGGNAETVNGHTINADVPADAVFTDTTYKPSTSSSDGLMSAADKKKLDGISNSSGSISSVNSIEPTDGNINLTQGLIPSDGTAYQMPFYIQSGTISINVDAGPTSAANIDIAFPNEFAETPKLMLTSSVNCYSDSTKKNPVIVGFDDLSESGFKIRAKTINSSNGIQSSAIACTAQWVAFGKIEV